MPITPNECGKRHWPAVGGKRSSQECFSCNKSTCETWVRYILVWITMASNEVEFMLHQYLREDTESNTLAFGKIYANYYPILLNYAISHLKDKMDAEDLVQDLFAMFWKERRELKDKGIDCKEKIEQHLVGRLTGQIANFNKRRNLVEKSSKILFHESLSGHDAQLIDEGLDTLELKEYQFIVSNTVRRLHYPHYSIYQLLKEKKHTIKEVSQMLGMTPKTVSKYRKEAVNFINNAIRKHYGFE